jgi:predicted amidohydrolase YtcJ
MPAVTVYTARSIITMERSFPEVSAVAVRDGRIVAVGSLESVIAVLGDSPYVVDRRFDDRVVLPGLIDQHLHPILGATTLMTEVIAPEDWTMPSRSFPAATTPDEYWQRLRAAESSAAHGEWLFSWGYHELWHGPLDRQRLDGVSSTRPIAVWQRSCHEWYLNSAAIDALGITAESMSGHGEASDMVDVEKGHFWESGWLTLLLPKLGPKFLTIEQLRAGLVQMVEYLHQHGVTAFNEPGIIWAAEPWNLYLEILGAEATPMYSTFLVDARSQATSGMDPADAVADAEAQIARSPGGKVSLVAKQVKLFADGAIISQLMQMRDGYLAADGSIDPDHRGEWMMPPDQLDAFASVYWDAGWQLHIHVNGDLGLDVVLDVIERCMVRRPRADHRTVIVHFANSTPDQIDRIARLGAIVSANPYYPVGFADKYGEFGLGPERADVMVRAASVLQRHVPLSFHSDLPMGPSEPLALASFAVNRVTTEGRVAGPDERISVEAALRGVTIEAAYSWRREHDLGSIAPGKIANFTVLAQHPYEIDPADLHHVPIVGTMFEGRWFPVGSRAAATSPGAPAVNVLGAAPRGSFEAHTACGSHSCGCAVARQLTVAIRALYEAA